MTGSRCLKCGRPVIRAQVSRLEHQAFDAEPTPGGAWVVWQSRKGSTWTTRAKERQYDAPGYQPHDCPGQAGQQMELGA